MALLSTPDGDELVTAHLAEHQKVRNVRRGPRVAVTILDPGPVGKVMRPYLAITGHPPGWLTRIRIDKVGGVGPWAS